MLPKCPECGGNSFDQKDLNEVCFDKRVGKDFVYIVYCDDCGHIIGCYNTA